MSKHLDLRPIRSTRATAGDPPLASGLLGAHQPVKALLDDILDALKAARAERGVPLFVLGAGVSNGVVPTLSEIAQWLHRELSDLNIWVKKDWRTDHALSIVSGEATRRQAAEFFTLIQRQEEPYQSIWRKFSIGFLSAGLTVGNSSFQGLSSSTPTPAHRVLAQLLARQEAHIISLNFDGLTRKALTEINQGGLVLHTERELRTYFCSASQVHSPALIKIRGDVLYARCANSACCLSTEPYPLERLSQQTTPKGMPICPNCSASELWLQFDFPGLRIKEEAAYPTLSSARRFLGPRISSIVTVGLSGRWDRYMLHFLLDLAIERRLLFIDVNHSPSSFIDDFRHLYYPSLQQWNTAPTAQVPPVYCHIPLKADEFFEFIKKNWYE